MNSSSSSYLDGMITNSSEKIKNDLDKYKSNKIESPLYYLLSSKNNNDDKFSSFNDNKSYTSEDFDQVDLQLPKNNDNNNESTSLFNKNAIDNINNSSLLYVDDHDDLGLQFQKFITREVPNAAKKAVRNIKNAFIPSFIKKNKQIKIYSEKVDNVEK